MIKHDKVRLLEQRVAALEAAVANHQRRYEQVLATLLGLVERNGKHIARAEHLLEQIEAFCARYSSDAPTLQ